MIRMLLLVAIFTGCTVLPKSDPSTIRGLESVETELAALATHFDVDPQDRISLSSDGNRFENMLQQLQAAIWRSQMRAQTATGSSERPSELALKSQKNCREAILNIYMITKQFSLSRESFEESQAVEICLGAANIEKALR